MRNISHNSLSPIDTEERHTSAILSEIFRGLPQSLQANAGTVPQFSHDRCLPNYFQFIIHPKSYATQSGRRQRR
jgi:hypothetical protein